VAARPVAGNALTALAWATNVILARFPGAEGQYAGLSLATVVFAAGVTGALAWRRVPSGSGGTSTRERAAEPDSGRSTPASSSR
jgi:hypothetical protein